MSKWQDIPKEDIEIDGDFINICLEGDEFGNNYAVVKIDDILELLGIRCTPIRLLKSNGEPL